jgi:lipooligosaccharide transport system ATP-binding protein
MARGRVVSRGRPRDLVAEHAGGSAYEFYGPPPVLDDVEGRARAAGYPTRRSGPAVAILRADGLRPADLDLQDDIASHPRPASLEDVFVLLTGEVVE